MLSTSPMRRALTPASCDILPTRRRAPSISAHRRQMATASAELPMEEEEQLPNFHQILDIFDAPARLGESSKLLARSPSVRRAAPSVDAALARKRNVGHVQPLPTPIIFDGPTRPRVAKTSLNASRAHSASSIAGRSPLSLPLPETFEGPSRLRPNNQGAFRDSSAVRTDPALRESLLILMNRVGQ